jgi:hypothetical protein
MARYSPGCTGWMIYCPRLDAWWQWKTVWRRPTTAGGFKEQPEVRPSKDEIESAFLEGHWWGKHDPETPQFEWYAVTTQYATQRRIEQLQSLVDETPCEIEEVEQSGDVAFAETLREKLAWYRDELNGFLAVQPSTNDRD